MGGTNLHNIKGLNISEISPPDYQYNTPPVNNKMNEYSNKENNKKSTEEVKNINNSEIESYIYEE